MRLRKIAFTLPLLLCVSQFSKPFSHAQAAAMDATDATALLAKSHVIDVKCSVLTKEKSQELKDFVARAEISLAEKASVSIARKTIAGGRAAGKLTACDATASKLVRDVLAAANFAVAAAVEDTTTSIKPQTISAKPAIVASRTQAKDIAVAEPAVAPQAKKSVVLVKPPKSKAAALKIVESAKVAKSTKIVKPAKGLGSYAAVAEKYYVAARCGTMSSSEISRLYKTVLSNHKQALADNRPADVRAVLRSAESRAGGKSCG